MSISSEQRENACFIACDGSFTAPRLHEVRSVLIKGLINADRVVLDIADITNIDLAGIQLICSAHRTAGRMNKVFSFEGQDRPVVLNLAARKAGYIRHAGCALDTDKSCLWASGKDGSQS